MRKNQIPNTKLQINPNIQIPNSKLSGSDV